MKKLLFFTLFLLVFLTGCEKKDPVPADAELFLLKDGETASGLKAGDGSKEFIKAYQDYEVLVSRSDSEIPNEVISINRIPYQDNISTMIANFFIDDIPMSVEDICREYEIETGELLSMLSSNDFLRTHEVLYRYLLFHWEDGAITRISSEELNYNETFEVPLQ